MNFYRLPGRTGDPGARLERRGIPRTDRVHLIVLPLLAGRPSSLWMQVCDVTGVDGTGMDARASRRNESLGLAEAEVMRRVSGEVNRGRPGEVHRRLLKNWFAENHAALDRPPRGSSSRPTAYPWVS